MKASPAPAIKRQPTPPLKPKPKEKKRPGLAASDLILCNDPLPTVRQKIAYKYDDTFSKLKPGMALKCPKAHVGNTASAFRAYLKRTGKPGKVQSCENYENDPVYGRIWLLEK